MIVPLYIYIWILISKIKMLKKYMAHMRLWNIWYSVDSWETFLAWWSIVLPTFTPNNLRSCVKWCCMRLDLGGGWVQTRAVRAHGGCGTDMPCRQSLGGEFIGRREKGRQETVLWGQEWWMRERQREKERQRPACFFRRATGKNEQEWTELIS